MSYEAEVLADSPSAWFRMGEASGTAAVDKMGGSSGTYGGGFALGVPGLVVGEADTAVDFNGTTGRLLIADRAAFDLGDVLTIEALLRFDTGLRRNTIVAKGTNAYVFRVHENNKLLLGKDGVAVIAETKTALSVGTIYHVAVTKNAATVKLYVNGVDDTGTVSNQTLANNNTQVTAWAYAGGTEHFFDGVGDELAFYSTALSAARIKAHSDAAFAAPGEAAPRRGLLLGVGK